MKWLGMGIAVATGIDMTSNWSLLWFMLIPAVVDLIVGKSDTNHFNFYGGIGDEE